MTAITESDLEKFVEEHEHFKNRRKQAEEENEILKNQLASEKMNSKKILTELEAFRAKQARRNVVWQRIRFFIKVLLIILFFVGCIVLTYLIYTNYDKKFGIIVGALSLLLSIVFGILSFFKIDYNGILKYLKK